MEQLPLQQGLVQGIRHDWKQRMTPSSSCSWLAANCSPLSLSAFLMSFDDIIGSFLGIVYSIIAQHLRSDFVQMQMFSQIEYENYAGGPRSEQALHMTCLPECVLIVRKTYQRTRNYDEQVYKRIA
jgi:hypothetical protein